MACSIIRNKKTGEITKVLASNGKESLLYNTFVKDLGIDKEQALRKWAMTQTTAFKRWFGDSQVVDKNNEPLIQNESFINNIYENKSAIGNYGEFSKTDPNMYLQEEVEQSEEILELEENLNTSIYRLFDVLGISVNSVNQIRDKDGNILKAISKADMVNKVIDVVQGKSDITTLPEEAAHFFVELLRLDRNPLYDSMMRNIHNYKVYDEVLENETQYEFHQGNITRLKQEAVGKLIVKHIIGNVQNEEVEQDLKRVTTWWDRILNFLKSIFGMITTNSYAEAARTMLNTEMLTYLKARNDLDSMTGQYLQEESKTQSSGTADNLIQALIKADSEYKLEFITPDDPRYNEYRFDKKPWLLDPETKGIWRYVHIETNIIIRGRPSDEVIKNWERMQTRKYRNITLPKDELERRDKIASIRKNTGTAIHLTLADLVQLHANKQGNLSEIYGSSPFTNRVHFDHISTGVRNVINRIKKVQKKIDPKGKVTFLTENKIYNPGKDVMGTIDFIAIFSDKEGNLKGVGVYDWKTISPWLDSVEKKPGKLAQIIEDPFTHKMDNYNDQIGQYIDALQSNPDYMQPRIKESRIIPIHVRHGFDKEKKVITSRITTVVMGAENDEYLADIPVAGELTDFKRVNDIINRLLERKKDILHKLDKRRYKTGEQYERAQERKKAIDMQLRKLQGSQDIAYVLTSLKDDLKAIKENIYEASPTDEVGDPNLNYISDDELNEILQDLTFYEHLSKVEDYEKYLEDNKMTEDLKELHKAQEIVGRSISSLKGIVLSKMASRTIKTGQKHGVAMSDDPLKGYNPGLSFMTSNFVSLSDQSNPYLQTLYGMMDKLNYEKRKIIKIEAAKISDLLEDVKMWGRQAGFKGINVFDKLINDETGNFIQKFKQQFYEEKKKASTDKNWQWFKDNMIIKEESYDRNFKKYRDGKYASLIRRYGSDPRFKGIIKKNMDEWDGLYDIKNHFKTASLSFGGLYFLRGNPDIWMSEEYKEVQNIEPLRKFHEYYQNKVREVEELFGIRLGPNFIAEVQKNIIETTFVNKGGMGLRAKQSLDILTSSLQLREQDKTLAQRDETTGEMKRQVPMVYITPIEDKYGNVDPSLKSRDLGKGLLLLYTAALDYKLKMDVLPQVLMMETILKENQDQEILSDEMGQTIKNVAGKAVKLFEAKSSAAVFTKFIDQYIFGKNIDYQEFKIKGQGPARTRISGLKSLLAAKQWHSMAVLGVRAPVAAGAFIAGMANMWIQGAKGRFVTKKNILRAQKELFTFDPIVRALAEKFDIYQRDDPSLRSERLSAEYSLRNITEDKWFWFLSTADRGIDVMVLSAVADNYGVNKETGLPEKLKNLPKESKSIKQLVKESMKKNPKWKGTLGVSQVPLDKWQSTIPGLSKEGELKLRNTARKLGRATKGNMTAEDKYLYQHNVFMRFLMHYKSWLPGIAIERFGALRYDRILETLEQGFYKTMWNNIGVDFNYLSPAEALDKEVHLITKLGAVGKSMVNIGIDIVTFGYANRFKVKEKRARAEFNKYISNQMENPQFRERLKTQEGREELFKEFIEMKQANIRGSLMEIRLALLFFMLISLAGGDWDKDGKKNDIRQSWAGRKMDNILNRSFREIAVFLQPQEWFDSGRSTGVPVISLGGDFIKGAGNLLDETRDDIFGENNPRDKANRFHYIFKLTPGFNALAHYMELSDTHKNAR